MKCINSDMQHVFHLGAVFHRIIKLNAVRREGGRLGHQTAPGVGRSRQSSYLPLICPLGFMQLCLSKNLLCETGFWRVWMLWRWRLLCSFFFCSRHCNSFTACSKHSKIVPLFPRMIGRMTTLSPSAVRSALS